MSFRDKAPHSGKTLAPGQIVAAGPLRKEARDRIWSAAVIQWPKYAGVALAALSVTTSKATAGMIPADATYFNIDRGITNNQSRIATERLALPFGLSLVAYHTHFGPRLVTVSGDLASFERWRGFVAVADRETLFRVSNVGTSNLRVPSCLFCKPPGTSNFQPRGANRVTVPFAVTTANYRGDQAWITFNWSMSVNVSLIYASTVAVEESSPGSGAPASSSPEPSTVALALLALGATGVTALRRQRRSASGAERSDGLTAVESRGKPYVHTR